VHQQNGNSGLLASLISQLVCEAENPWKRRINYGLGGALIAASAGNILSGSQRRPGVYLRAAEKTQNGIPDTCNPDWESRLQLHL